MPPERTDLFGNHSQYDSCKTLIDLHNPLGILITLGWLVLSRETTKNLRRYGLWGFRFRGIAQEGLRNIQEFIRQGGTQVEHPLVLTPPTNFDANNYPLGTYLRTYVDLHFLFSPKTPEFITRWAYEDPPGVLRRLQVRDSDYIVGQGISVGLVTQAPNPAERFIIYSIGSDQQILLGRHGYNSWSTTLRIGEWYHIPVQGPKSFLGDKLDMFTAISKVEILQAGQTEAEKAPVGKRILVTN